MLYFVILYGCDKTEPHIVAVAPKMKDIKSLLEERTGKKFEDMELYVDEGLRDSADDVSEEYRNDASNHMPPEIQNVTCAIHVASSQVEDFSQFNEFLKNSTCLCVAYISIFKSETNAFDFGKILNELEIH